MYALYALNICTYTCFKQYKLNMSYAATGTAIGVFVRLFGCTLWMHVCVAHTQTHSHHENTHSLTNTHTHTHTHKHIIMHIHSSALLWAACLPACVFCWRRALSCTVPPTAAASCSGERRARGGGIAAASVPWRCAHAWSGRLWGPYGALCV